MLPLSHSSSHSKENEELEEDIELDHNYTPEEKIMENMEGYVWDPGNTRAIETKFFKTIALK